MEVKSFFFEVNGLKKGRGETDQKKKGRRRKKKKERRRKERRRRRKGKKKIGRGENGEEGGCAWRKEVAAA